MKKYLSILLLVMVTGLSINFSNTTKTEAAFNAGGNKIETYYLKSNPKEKLFFMSGTSPTNAQTIYNAVRPATYAEAQDMANQWNRAKSYEVLYIRSYQDERCPFNPSYCSSQGKNYGSKVEIYGITWNIGDFTKTSWIKY